LTRWGFALQKTLNKRQKKSDELFTWKHTMPQGNYQHRSICDHKYMDTFHDKQRVVIISCEKRNRFDTYTLLTTREQATKSPRDKRTLILKKYLKHTKQKNRSGARGFFQDRSAYIESGLMFVLPGR